MAKASGASKKAVSTESSSSGVKPVVLEFVAPKATTVLVAGSFNDWQGAITPLKKGRNGKWSVALALPPGRYEYRYVVDGTWVNDQKTPMIPNPFGSANNILEV
jgi:1,4-alpha-glucan branching enzyme